MAVSYHDFRPCVITKVLASAHHTALQVEVDIYQDSAVEYVVTTSLEPRTKSDEECCLLCFGTNRYTSLKDAIATFNRIQVLAEENRLIHFVYC